MEEFSKTCKCCGQTKTIDHFKKTRWGTRVDVCTECSNQKRHDNRVKKQQAEETERAKAETIAKTRKQRLKDYTPRELMQELVDRGYEFEITYTEVHKISSRNF